MSDPTNGRWVKNGVDFSNLDFGVPKPIATYLQSLAEEAVEYALTESPPWILVYPGSGNSHDIFLELYLPLGEYDGHEYDPLFRFNFSRILMYQQKKLGEWDEAKALRYATCLRSLADKIERHAKKPKPIKAKATSLL